MTFQAWAATQPVRAFLRLLTVAALALAATGCATHFVDGAVKDVPASDFARPAAPAPVQLVFEFRTKGVPNPRATEHVRPLAVEDVKATGLFSELTDKPVPGGAMLNVVIENVALTDDAFAKGFMTGLTLGLAGSTVTDGYTCTVSYLPPGRTQPIVKTSKHAIHTSMGATGAPANAYKAKGIDDAVRTMVRQILAGPLRDLSREPEFK